MKINTFKIVEKDNNWTKMTGNWRIISVKLLKIIENKVKNSQKLPKNKSNCSTIIDWILKFCWKVIQNMGKKTLKLIENENNHIKIGENCSETRIKSLKIIENEVKIW